MKIPMQDGVHLSVNVWRPDGEGRFPVICMMTPYDSTSGTGTTRMNDMIGHAKYFVPRGYVFASIDFRGRYNSEGTPYEPGPGAVSRLYWPSSKDVDDSLTWLGTQSWSSGAIGMTGGSALGFAQWVAASLGNPFLRTIISYVSPDDFYETMFPHGVFRLAANLVALAVYEGRHNNSNLRMYFWDWEDLYRHLPLQTMDEALLGKKSQLWQDLMEHPDNDEYWRFSVGERLRSVEMKPGKYPEVKIPTLSVTGWYDVLQQDAINNFLGMVRYGPSGHPGRHHLMVGPWMHIVGPRKVGDLDFGPQADVDFGPVELRWFDHWLQGIDNGLLEEPPVNIFVMGKNKWRREQEWPLSRARKTRYYLHSSGTANSGSGDGRLSTVPPANEPTDNFVYDPRNPVPTQGGAIWREPAKTSPAMTGRPASIGPRDQRPLEMREDVLAYPSQELSKDTEVTGRILVTLYAASSAPDTDFTAKLVDVHPDGYAQILTDGVVRARHRNSFAKQELIRSGKVYEYLIDLESVSHVFKKKHRIRVDISSSNFPKYDRNPNTGHRFGTDVELRKASQTIFHDSQHPSHIALPVVP